jgi:RHS repeat-associated protein
MNPVCAIVTALAAGLSLITASGAQMNPPATVQVNRTVPQVSSPRIGLEFSAQPTVAEFFRARVFEVSLVPIGGEPGAEENAALATALLDYGKRGGPDDFSSLTGFLEKHPNSPWRAALLTGLGFEYFNTAHYSLALQAWTAALECPARVDDVKGMVVLARAAEELALLYARLGRLTELEALLKPYGDSRGSEKINQAREALWLMKNQPGISFRCGPLALQCILLSHPGLLASSLTNAMSEIGNAASPTDGFALTEVAGLAERIGLSFQMAFRQERRSPTRRETFASGDRHAGSETGAPFIVPSVVHWKAGHYAAIVRREGDRYLLQDPTFGKEVWATSQALEAEASGYFLIPKGELSSEWRRVDDREGRCIRGKGVTAFNDGDVYSANDLQTGGSCSVGMPMASVHLMTVNVSMIDTPLAYTPPVGPPVRFTVRYNSRDLYAQDRLFGGYYWNGLSNTNIYFSLDQVPAPSLFVTPFTRMTHDWVSYIVDSPQNPLANVTYVVGGGGARTFRDFNPASQSFAPEKYDQTLLRRSGPASYELLSPDGSKMIFNQSDSSIGTSRRVYLNQILDPFGNALTLTYDANLRLVAVTDAIGQVTTLTYGDGINLPEHLLTRVTDPFARTATFEYEERTKTAILRGIHRTFTQIGETVITNDQNVVFDHDYHVLVNMTDMLGLTSQPNILESGGDLDRFVTPYGETSFLWGGGGTNGNTRFAEIIYPDHSRERVEYNQSTNVGLPYSEPAHTVPTGFAGNVHMYARNTYYWSRTANASHRGDYTKARIYHWLHDTPSVFSTAGVLESVKEPLEGRVWYDYGISQRPTYIKLGSTRPTKVGRVLDDGRTQLYTYGYNGLGKLTNSVDPVGRSFSFLYADNDIDLLEIRQTRAGDNDLLLRATYNAQHQPLTIVDAAGQTNSFAYNPRGQLLAETNPKGETTSYAYDADGYLQSVDGPLPGTNDVVQLRYDVYGRVRRVTDESGYALNFTYDEMDRLTGVIYPDLTFDLYTYDRLDLAVARDRAGRETFFEYDNMRQLRKQTDPLGRVTYFDWCQCGDIKSLTDPMGRTTSWETDVQGRTIAKLYPDGSRVSYVYEDTTSRLRAVVDEKQQVTQFRWNLDGSLQTVSHGNSVVPTPGVSFTYDPDYQRVLSMTDGTGTTRYSYHPITGAPVLGAGALASVDGPLPSDTITYGYDELGRAVHRAINGVGMTEEFDEAGRLIGLTNVLGAFGFDYEGVTGRMNSKSLPTGQTETRGFGNIFEDLKLQRITHSVGTAPLSEFLYGLDVAAGRIATWSQQAGAQPPLLHTFGYDAVNQLLSVAVTHAGELVGEIAYSYDLAGNRLTEHVAASTHAASYNALNEISTTTASGFVRTNEWDALDRLVAVNVGDQRTEFTYDGLGRRVAIRQLEDGSEVSYRRFVWCGSEICEERDAVGVVTKRFFPEGMKLESGPNSGTYFYTRDHLGSVRELADASGSVRARYAYDPYGRRTKVSGDLETDFGFAGMFWSGEANLSLTYYRAYDPELGRWLSRDPLPGAEVLEGPNLYVYVLGDPINQVDPLGLFTSLKACFTSPGAFAVCAQAGIVAAQQKGRDAARFVGQQVQRAGAAIRNCFSRSSSTPNSPADTLIRDISTAPADITVIPRVARAPTLPGWNPAGVFNNYAARTAQEFASRSSAVNQVINATPKSIWFYQMVERTRDTRTSLPVDKAFEAWVALIKRANELFGPGGMW